MDDLRSAGSACPVRNDFFWLACARPGCRRNEHNAAGGSTCRRAAWGSRLARGNEAGRGGPVSTLEPKRATPRADWTMAGIEGVCREAGLTATPPRRGPHQMCKRESGRFGG